MVRTLFYRDSQAYQNGLKTGEAYDLAHEYTGSVDRKSGQPGFCSLPPGRWRSRKRRARRTRCPSSWTGASPWGLPLAVLYGLPTLKKIGEHVMSITVTSIHCRPTHTPGHDMRFKPTRAV